MKAKQSASAVIKAAPAKKEKASATLSGSGGAGGKTESGATKTTGKKGSASVVSVVVVSVLPNPKARPIRNADAEPTRKSDRAASTSHIQT